MNFTKSKLQNINETEVCDFVSHYGSGLTLELSIDYFDDAFCSVKNVFTCHAINFKDESFSVELNLKKEIS